MGAALVGWHLGLLPAAPAQEPPGTIGLGVRVAGTRRPGETPLPGRGPSHRFRFVPGEDGRATLSLESIDFDAFLRIEGAGGEAIVEADRGGIETDVRVIVAISKGSEYRVLVAAAGAAQSGEYTLRVERGEAPFPEGEALLDSRIEFRRRAADRALARGDAASALVHRLEEADRRFERSQHHEAGLAYEAALERAREAGDRPAEARALGGLAIVDRFLRRFDAARVRLTAYLSIVRERRDRPGEAWALGALGNVEFSAGRWAEAKGRYEGQRAILRELEDPAGEMRALENLGNVALSRGDPREARLRFEE